MKRVTVLGNLVMLAAVAALPAPEGEGVDLPASPPGGRDALPASLPGGRHAPRHVEAPPVRRPSRPMGWEQRCAAEERKREAAHARRKAQSAARRKQRRRS